MHTLDYVVNQSEYTVETLRNVTGYLSLAKTVSVAQIFLPSDVENDIDRLNVELNSAADTLELKTKENSSKIRKVLSKVYVFCYNNNKILLHLHTKALISLLLIVGSLH